MKNRCLLNIFFLLLACIITISTTLEKVDVFSKNDLRAISCGWPINFIERDHSWRDPPYPYKITCGFISYEETTRAFYWSQFMIDILIFYALIFFISRIFLPKKLSPSHV